MGTLLLVLATGGCDTVSLLGGEDPSEFPLELEYEAITNGAVNVEQIDRGSYGDIVEGTQTVLRDEEAYAAFWERLHADRSSVPERPEINFENKVVVGLVLGERPSGGYSIKINDIRSSENSQKIQVQYTEVVPGDGCAVTMALTSPYVLLAVETQAEEVIFSRSEETRSC
ncbi:MAG: protease complex subunit PrcB family protein [Salinibacter sp.]